MNQDEDYASDSDQSDEDFCPDKEVGGGGGDSEALSEEDTDDKDSEEDCNKDAKQESKKKRNKKATKQTKRTKKKVTQAVQEEKQDLEDQPTSRRCTRQAADEDSNCKANVVKDELDSDEDDKSRTDALWADFLSDVKPAGSVAKKPTATVPTKSTNGNTGSNTKKVTVQSKQEEKKVEKPAPTLITVTEILDFAGEEVRVEKVVNADSIKENQIKTSQDKASSSISPRGLPAGLKRPAAGGSGLGSLLNQIGKKKKISVLEKTQLDWTNYKQVEGIEEELQTHNKGKDGFLERQDFLQRTDVRQFEIEKSLRQSKRN